MPLYDYKCRECGHECEEYHSIHSDLTLCPVCGEDAYRRVPVTTSGAMERQYQKPIEMHSVATDNPAEIRSLRDAGVEVRDGVPIARTRKEKLTVLKKMGFREKR